ncbi:MAG: tetratricopeptide repeat protein [Thermodesulfovibrionia bacterium]|nr:tetratricopeptide repeat protein [Thermodesulfovibrionia bacterium]
MKNSNFYLSAAKYLAFSLVLFLPVISYSSRLFHSVQTGSFVSLAIAHKQYGSIEQKLNKQELDNLRIERIGKFYSVRVGKFNDFASAEKFLKSAGSRLPKATVMEVYIKHERIIKSYTVDRQRDRETPLSVDAHKEVTPQTAKKTDITEKAVPLAEKIAAIADHVNKKDFNAALEIINAEIASQPEHPGLNAWLGVVLLKMDQPLEALKYLKKSTELSPDVSDYHNGLGYSLFFLDRYDEAINAFNRAVILDPGHFDALTGLCIVYAKSGKKEKAMDIYNKLKDLDRENADRLLQIIDISRS